MGSLELIDWKKFKQSLKWFLAGLVLLACGVVVLGNAVTVSVAMITFTSVLLLLGGGVQIAVGFWTEGGGNRLLAWTLGGLTLLLGWFFLANPLEGVLSLTTLILLLLVATGLVQIVFSFLRRAVLLDPNRVGGFVADPGFHPLVVARCNLEAAWHRSWFTTALRRCQFCWNWDASARSSQMTTVCEYCADG